MHLEIGWDLANISVMLPLWQALYNIYWQVRYVQFDQENIYVTIYNVSVWQAVSENLCFFQFKNGMW